MQQSISQTPPYACYSMWPARQFYLTVTSVDPQDDLDPDENPVSDPSKDRAERIGAPTRKSAG